MQEHVVLSQIEDRVRTLEGDSKRFDIAIAEIKVMVCEIQKDITEIKETLNKMNYKKGNNMVELKRYEYLLMIGTIILSLISLTTLIFKKL